MTTASNSNADSKAVARNAATHYGSLFLNVGLGLVVTPMLLQHLGQDGFGYYTSVLALASYVGLGEFGLGTATVRRIASDLARGDEEGARRVVSTARAIYLATATTGIVLTLVFALLAGRILNAPTEWLAQAQVALVLLGTSASLSFVFTVYPAIVIGAGRSDVLTLAGGLLSALTSVAQILTVLISEDLRLLAGTTAAFALTGSAISRRIAMRRYPGLQGPLGDASRTVARQLLTSGWRNAAITIGALAAYNADVLIVGAYLSVGAVAAYGVATRAAGLMSSLTFRLSEVLVPTYSHHDATGDKSRLRDIYLESTLAAAAIAIPASAALVAFGASLLDLWLGTTPDGAARVLAILALALLLAVPGGTAFYLLSGINELRFATWASVAGGVANAGLGIALTPAIGLTGPAIATLILRGLVDLILLPLHVCHLLGTPAGAWWRSVGRVVGPTLVVTAGVATLLRPLTIDAPAWRTLVACLLMGSVHLVVFAMASGAERRRRYTSLLRRSNRRTAS